MVRTVQVQYFKKLNKAVRKRIEILEDYGIRTACRGVFHVRGCVHVEICRSLKKLFDNHKFNHGQFESTLKK